MGIYLNGGSLKAKGKAATLMADYDGVSAILTVNLLLWEENLLAWEDIPENQCLVAVVGNEFFDAAGVAYDKQEYEDITRDLLNNSLDHRPRWFVLVDKEKIKPLMDKIPEGF